MPSSIKARAMSVLAIDADLPIAIDGIIHSSENHFSGK